MDADYKVTCASDGTQCLELLKNNKIPDLILLDIMMPKMSGWETFKNLQENPLWKDIPVFFLTARTDRIAKNAGDFLASEFIQKPFDIEDLKKRIDKVLKNTGNIGKE
jgi:CheY-like chemotaxis protein